MGASAVVFNNEVDGQSQNATPVPELLSRKLHLSDFADRVIQYGFSPDNTWLLHPRLHGSIYRQDIRASHVDVGANTHVCVGNLNANSCRSLDCADRHAQADWTPSDLIGNW